MSREYKATLLGNLAVAVKRRKYIVGAGLFACLHLLYTGTNRQILAVTVLTALTFFTFSFSILRGGYSYEVRDCGLQYNRPTPLKDNYFSSVKLINQGTDRLGNYIELELKEPEITTKIYVEDAEELAKEVK